MLVLYVQLIHSSSKGLFGFNDFNLVKLQEMAITVYKIHDKISLSFQNREITVSNYTINHVKNMS